MMPPFRNDSIISLAHFALICVILLHYSTGIVNAVDVASDKNEMCSTWAESGECEKNPGYMKIDCATSCRKIELAALKDTEELSKISSFFDLSANDIHGTEIPFEKYRGQVIIITNVASYCGYTASHYKGLVELWSQVKDSKINILAFPCNQFGKQEPGTANEIEAFAKKKGVQFTMMSKINVNGPDAHIVYKYLKSVTGTKMIQWNFASYFVIDPDGNVTAHNGVEPMDLLEFSLGLLKSDEL